MTNLLFKDKILEGCKWNVTNLKHRKKQIRNRFNFRLGEWAWSALSLKNHRKILHRENMTTAIVLKVFWIVREKRINKWLIELLLSCRSSKTLDLKFHLECAPKLAVVYLEMRNLLAKQTMNESLLNTERNYFVRMLILFLLKTDMRRTLNFLVMNRLFKWPEM